MRMWFAQGHHRWEEQAAAFVDGELTPAEVLRFETHLTRCTRCQETVATHRAMKGLLTRSLPAVAAPRSFALTPEMLAGARTPVALREPSRQRVLVMRFAQAAAAVAVLGFGAVLAADLASDDETTTSGLAPASEDMATGRAAGDTKESAVGTTSDQSGSITTNDLATQVAPAPPQYTPDGGGAQGVTPPPMTTPAPPRQGGTEDSATPNDVPGTADTSLRDEAGGDGTAVIGEAMSAEDESDGLGALRVAEIAFAAFGVVALAGWAVARRKQRS